MKWRRLAIAAALTAAILGGVFAWAKMKEERASVREPLTKVLDAELLRASRTPPVADIQPYEECLVYYEYRISKVIDGMPGRVGDKILVAHWGIIGGQNQELSPRPGEIRRLEVARLEDAPGVASLRFQDDFKFNLDTPLFVDVAGHLVSPKAPDAIRYDYRGKVSGRMRIYWLLRAQLRVAIVGNSHSGMGIRGEVFPPSENREVPIATNLSLAGSGVSHHGRILREYLVDLPKLEWIIWGLSPRMFNANHGSGWKDAVFAASPGYQFDRRHREMLWPVDQVAPVAKRETEALTDRFDPWGGTGRDGTKLEFASRTELVGHVEEACRDVDFEFDDEAWEAMCATAREVAGSGIKLVLFTPPLHPAIREAGRAADPDWTGRDDYEDLVARLREFASGNAPITFVDGNDGSHGIRADHFWDLDHLNKVGAAHFTARLAGLMR